MLKFMGDTIIDLKVYPQKRKRRLLCHYASIYHHNKRWNQ